MTEATAATIPPLRQTAYANTASTTGDIPGLMISIHRICTDRAILKREGRTRALSGADRLLADVVRRLCATATLSEEEAKTKVGLLDSAKRLYGERKGDILMAAMIDAAIGIETECWLTPSTQH